MKETFNTEHPIILFDGVCKFCNASINFIIRKDKKKKFRFLPIQMTGEKEIMKKLNQRTIQTDSIILIENQKSYIKSTAVIHIAIELGGIYKAAILFFIIPTFIRDFLYDIIARYRYTIFGKYDSCMVPDPELKDRFVI
ncbi:thiol-disulfide oxidoreductase DCC family protein [candidate division KSB1 bacterium]